MLENQKVPFLIKLSLVLETVDIKQINIQYVR